MNFTRGSQPKRDLSRRLSATRFIGPVGISGRKAIAVVCPVYG